MSCYYSEKGLDLDTAIRFLENIEDYPSINQPPVKPKGGEVFIFLPNSLNEQENYKCDQYRWLNSGPKEIPRKNPLVKKQYFIGKLPQGKTQAFQKHCYILISDQRIPYPVLLHYIGDATVMVDYPHGNSKKCNDAYFAIAPSVRRDIANRATNLLPTAVINSYKEGGEANVLSIKDDGEKYVNPVLTPRNKSQVRNIRRKQKMTNVKEGLPLDDLNTLHSIGSELLSFCHYIRTRPDLACIVGLTDISTEVENLLKLTNNVVVFSFLENYKVGNYTITPFNFIHSAFADTPAIPCYFLISEQSDFFVYEKFLHTILELIPALEECQTAVITNQDYHFTSSLTVAFTNWLQIYDWEILFVATRAFLRKINIDIKDISLRIKQIKFLMSCESFETYTIELERFKLEWPTSLTEYYTQVLQEPIQSRLARWLLERYRIYSPHMGVIRGINSDLQLVIKHLQELKDISLDVILPSLFHLQTYLHATIKRGFCGIGKYSLSSSFNFLKQDMDELALPSKIYEPSSIVRIFRVRGITLFAEDNDSSVDDHNSLLQAQRIVEIGNISHSSSLKAFLVKSTSGSLHGVQLFPRESCSCSINQRCAHIMAVMMVLGMPVSYDKKGAIKVLKPQMVSTPSPDIMLDLTTCLLKVTNEENRIHMNNNYNVLASPNIISTSIATPVNITCSEAVSRTFEEIASAATNAGIADTESHAGATNVSVSYSHMPPAGGCNPTAAQVSYTSIAYEEPPNVFHVHNNQLENVLHAAQGNEVLMVVGNDNQVGDVKPPLIAYEVTPEAMIAYSQTPSQQSNLHTLQMVEVPEQGELRIDTSLHTDEDHLKKTNLDLDMPPEQLILTMSEAMHKAE